LPARTGALSPLRVAFLGTPQVAVPTLTGLVDAGHDVAVVVSRPDTRRGRGGALTPSPVKETAVAAGLRVSARVDDLLDAEVELGVVVAFGALIRPPVLGRVPLVNVHFSLLPRWRGAAPVERAILAGDEVTGVSLMEVEAGLDTGGVYRSVETRIGPAETAAELADRLALLGRDLLLDALATGLGTPRPQLGEPVYAAKIEPEERCLDWRRSTVELLRVVRIGRAWTTLQGRRLVVVSAKPVASVPPSPPGHLQVDADGPRVATGDGWLRLLAVRPEGRGTLEGSAWARGARLGPDALVGT
jgi:methionyl-tRNA formyltransferase